MPQSRFSFKMARIVEVLIWLGVISTAVIYMVFDYQRTGADTPEEALQLDKKQSWVKTGATVGFFFVIVPFAIYAYKSAYKPLYATIGDYGFSMSAWWGDTGFQDRSRKISRRTKPYNFIANKTAAIPTPTRSGTE
jgi:hypothetical protein